MALIMSSQRLHGGRVTLFLLLSCCRLSFAVAPAPQPTAPTPAPAPAVPVAPAAPAAPTIYVSPANPASVSGPFGDSSANDTTPALRALPVDATAGGPDASTFRKFYTLTAALRETYDDNSNTGTSGNKQASLETEISPSILVDFPTPEGEFTGRYTFGLTYYEDAPSLIKSSGNNPNASSNLHQSGSFEMSHDLDAQYTHAFSSRFQLSLGEELRYQIEPDILQSIGTNYQQGAFLSNQLTGTFSAQWTPKFSTLTTFSDTIVRYQNSSVAYDQNSVENSGAFTANYAVLPKITASAGGQIDDDSYESANRGYTSYTLFGGGSWQALPSLSFTGRGGASYTKYVNSANGNGTSGNSSGEVTPYAALSANWALGARSSLNFSYSHSVTPSSQTGANGQLSDRFSASFAYQITPRLSAHLDGIFTAASVTSSLATSNGGLPSDYQENSYAIDAGMNYTYNSHFSIDWGTTFSGVVSNIDNGNYNRDEAYVGVRGTY